ncbi:MAG: metal-dependent hydrolase [Candidatus Liptonbacteria bacterium]|nr:metal-dependent hydrolase [Candidatus Liptonbacteria bacterium]
MTPIGHAAAGYAVTYAALEIANKPLPDQQITSLIFWGIFWAVIVDWDQVITLVVGKSLRLRVNKFNHRRSPSHAPLVWLALCGIAYLFANSPYGHTFTFVMLLGSMSHMLLDSIEYGIMWRWPFGKKLYALEPGLVLDFPQDGSLVGFYWNMTKAYAKTKTSYAEMFMVIFALVFFAFVSF